MKIAGIRFNIHDRVYDIDQKEINPKVGDKVIVDIDQGNELGEVVFCDKITSDKGTDNISGFILRKATTTDIEKAKRYAMKSAASVLDARAEVKKLKLKMKLVDALFSLDGSKVTFYFTADERVDFRELVKTLTRQFQKSIRMQQIGSRDVTKIMGGHGVCGREICCHGFLNSFQSITTDMVKLQQIAQGNEKISGVCGRLMCCLGYEFDYYRETDKIMPRLGMMASTSKGKGKIISRNLLNKTADVILDNNDRITFSIEEISWK